MRPTLIAECCQNHNGDKDILQRMIHTAAENGADYVKIQAIRSEEVAYRERFEEGVKDESGEVLAIKRPYQAEVDRLSKLDLDPSTEEWFVQECVRAGVAPMTTVFTRAGVERVKDQGYEAIKIASYDCRSYPLLRDVKKYWSTIFVSTGSSFDDEIERAAAELEGTNFTMLHCVTIYPTPLTELHLKRLNYLRRYTHQIGYSDHSEPAKDGLWASKLAIAFGASCVERHYTILAPEESRDGKVSITPSMLKELRDFGDLSRQDQMAHIREGWPKWEEALGNAQRPLSKAELLNRDYYAGRFASKVNGRDVFNWEDRDLNR